MRIAILALTLFASGCDAADTPVPEVYALPAAVVAPAVIVKIQSEVLPLVPPKSPAGKAMKKFREEETAAKNARSFPGATVEQLREIDDTERRAHGAVQNLIDKAGSVTTADEQRARDRIDELRRARQAPREGIAQ